MDQGFPFEIIFFAMVAAFIVLRLRSVLGRRTGHERPPPETMKRSSEGADDNVIQLPDQSEEEARAEAELAAAQGSPVAAALAQIKIADRGFDPATFLAGARTAYEMIISAFARGDTRALRPLLNDDVYDDFAGAINERREKNQTLESTLVSIKAADIVDAAMKGGMAEVTVKFRSEIVNVLRDASGEVVEGDPTSVHDVTDVWTFGRNTRSSDPNWTLIETRTSE